MALRIDILFHKLRAIHEADADDDSDFDFWAQEQAEDEGSPYHAEAAEYAVLHEAECEAC